MNGSLNGGSISGKIDINATLHGTISIASGGSPVLENVSVKSTGVTQTVTAGEGYDGIGEVTVSPISLQSKNVTPSIAQRFVTADSGYDGLSLVTVGAVNLQSKSVTPSSVQQTIEPDSGYMGLSSITVGAMNLQSKNVNPSIYGPMVVNPDIGYNGLSSVTVSKVNLQSKTVSPTSQQQVVTPDSGYMGLSKVTVGASEDNLEKIFSHSASYGQPINISVSQTESTCYGFAGKYNLTITGGGNYSSIGRNAFTYQKYLHSIVADDIKYMSSGDELSYSGLVTGHFANLMELHNNTFRGCTAITDLYFGYNDVISGMLTSGRIFDGKSSGTVNIHVPASQLSAYQADSKWQGIVSAEAAAGVTVNIVGDYA